MTHPSAHSGAAALRPLTNRWLVLSLLVLIAVLNYADRFLLSGMAQPIKSAFGIGDAMMGLLMGPAFALLYTIFTIPAARLADTRSRVMIIAGGCAVWSLFTALSGMAADAWLLALARVGVGIGEAAYQAPAAALVAAYFPIEQRGKALAMLGTAIYFGQIAGLAGGPAMAEQWGWRSAFYALGLTGLIVAAAAALIIREPQRETVAGSAPVAPPLAAVLRRIVATPSIRLIALLMAFGMLSGMTFGLWGPALFERAYGLSNKEAGSTFAFTFGLPGLVGMILFGALADRLARRSQAAVLGLGAASIAATSTLILGIVWTDSLALARALAIPAGLLGGGWSVGVLATLQYLLPNALRATGTGVVLLISGFLGSVIGPVLAGQMSDWVADPASGAWGLRIGLSVAMPLAYIGAWSGWRAMRSLERDRAALHDGAEG
ncbi:MAG: MFS transporter [Sphingomonadales bacterium]|nr:MFS transporter [Sphingomonadales bacterium]